MSRNILDEETTRFGRLLHYLGLLIAVVIGTAVYSYAHAPLVKSIVHTTGRIDELRQSLKNTSGAYEERERLLSKVRESKDRIKAVYQRVPAEADTAPFLKELSSIAQDERIRLSEYRPGAATVKEGYSQMEIALSGEGSYPAICSFFHRLAELPRLSKIKTLTIQTSPGAVTYPVSATIVIYYDLSGNLTSNGTASHDG
jgi:Tfp pilus assembly protein PilO